jgi:hypothetical protein
MPPNGRVKLSPWGAMSGGGPGSSAPSAARERGHASAAPRPDLGAMRRWLLGDTVIDRDGAVISWTNPRHPGYPYPEAAGLLLSTLSTASGFAADAGAAADRIAGALCNAIGADGGIGRDGTTYLFDSAVALAGLLRYRRAGGRVDCDPSIHRLRRFLCEQIAARVAVLPRSAEADGRWSTQFGAHLLKCVHSLHLYARTFGDELRDDLVATLIERSGHQPSPVYIHPFCYEQEGHLLIEHYGLCRLFEPIDGALEWLAALQREDGAIRAFANGMDGFGEARSDATAQAVRLWLLRDRARYADAITRGLAFLAACQDPQGGIRYSPAGADVCSWSTMFAWQATQWFADRPCPDDLL